MSATDATASVPLARHEEVLARLDELERRMAVVEAPPAEAPSSPPAGATRLEAVGRRRALLGLAGAAAAGAAALATPAPPVAAANDDPLKIAFGNTATGGTALTVSGTTASHGFAVVDQSLASIPRRAALFGHATQRQLFGVFGYAVGDNPNAAVMGEATGNAVGVRGTSKAGPGGLFSNTSADPTTAALSASNLSKGGAAIRASATTHVHLVPNDAMPPAEATPQMSDLVGQLRWVSPAATAERDSDLWACTKAGFPGTWRKIVGISTAGAFHLLPTPVRVYDSRPGTVPTQGPKTPLPEGNVARTVDLTHNGSTVPPGATGVLLTVLLINATAGAGNLTIWANDKPKPQSNTMVWGGDAGRFTALAMTAVDPTAKVKVDASLQTNVVLDVVGYHR